MAWLTGWPYRKKITVRSSYVDADLAEFPLLVKIIADVDMAAARGDGYDLRFTDSDGVTELPYERDSWSGGNGATVNANIWVRVPFIGSAVGAELYVYYGKADAYDGQQTASVWDSNFQAVYHLNNLQDSTANGRHLTAYNTPQVVAGKIGNCYSFSRNLSQYLLVWWSNIIRPVTISMWGKTNYSGGQILGGFGASSLGGYPQAATGSGFFGPAYLLTEHPSLLNAAPVYGTPGDDLWHYFSGSWIAATSRRLRVDNSVTTDNSNNTWPSGLDNFMISGRNASGCAWYWHGMIDEVRVSNVERSLAWSKFEYFNMHELDGAVNWGIQERFMPIQAFTHHQLYRILRSAAG